MFKGMDSSKHAQQYQTLPAARSYAGKSGDDHGDAALHASAPGAPAVGCAWWKKSGALSAPRPRAPWSRSRSPASPRGSTSPLRYAPPARVFGEGRVRMVSDVAFAGADGGLTLALDAVDADWERLVTQALGGGKITESLIWLLCHSRDSFRISPSRSLWAVLRGCYQILLPQSVINRLRHRLRSSLWPVPSSNP